MYSITQKINNFMIKNIKHIQYKYNITSMYHHFLRLDLYDFYGACIPLTNGWDGCNGFVQIFGYDVSVY